MKATYRFLAYLILFLVLVQAAAISFGFFGVGSWVEDGHSLTKSVMEDNSAGITGEAGLAVHAINGQMLIPLVALVLLVVSFFAKIDGGVKWAALVFGDVVVQVLLAFVSFGAPIVGVLHGLNAFVLFGLGMTAGAAATRSIKGSGTATPAATTV